MYHISLLLSSKFGVIPLLRDQCLGYGAATKRPRRVSAVLWPLSISPKRVVSISPPQPAPTTQEESATVLPEPLPGPLETCSPSASHPLLWGDWERCQIRRRWIGLIRTQAVTLTITTSEVQESVPLASDTILTRAERAHYRLSWEQRLARNARSPNAPPIEMTIHGLPASFAHFFGFSLVA